LAIEQLTCDLTLRTLWPRKKALNKSDDYIVSIRKFYN
jgi:hypothetical protein